VYFVAHNDPPDSFVSNSAFERPDFGIGSALWQEAMLQILWQPVSVFVNSPPWAEKFVLFNYFDD